MAYTNEGFAPESVTVAAGDVVRFINVSDWDFWPASNIHPTHDILPEFDSLQPIPPQGSWSHQFDKLGRWYYHDHLAPEKGGLVAVEVGEAQPQQAETVEEGESEPSTTGVAAPTGDVSSAPASTSPLEDLDPLVLEMPDREFEAIPQELLSDVSAIFSDDAELEAFIERYGLSGALQTLKQIELDSGADCHNRAHEAGRIGYEMFGSAAFALATHECQSGGLHGATEALFADRGTARLAEDIAVLCHGAPNSFVRHQCLHGIGHGLMAWTNYDLPIALSLCDEASPGSDRSSCYSGIFMENVVGGLSGAMGHYTEWVRPDDPVFPCDVVETRYQPDCYFYQTSHMAVVLNWDMAEIAALCDQAPLASQPSCYSSFGRDVATLASDDPATAISLCQHAEDPIANTYCIQGAVQNGFWEPPGAQRAAQFCALLDSDPQAHQASIDGCYITITQRAQNVLVTPDALQAFCNLLPQPRQPTCQL